MRNWLLLHYKIPPEPSASRVYIWRKLKRLGALLLHDSVWLLPRTSWTLEQFQWLAAEIVEMQGEALLWEAHPALVDQEEALVKRFNRQVEAVYLEILAALGRPEPDLEALSRQYQQARGQDYFDSPVGERARAALLAARGGEACNG
jgi:hypothetical protein